MILSFRQGIVRQQTDPSGNPAHLVKSSLDNRFVDLIVSPEHTIVAVADRDEDYLFAEDRTIRRAWGPLDIGSRTYYLYWDIDQVSGEITRGATSFAPIVSPTIPTLRRDGQFWFDLRENRAKVYDEDRGRFIPKLRVFAGFVNQQGTIFPNNVGSQADLTNEVRAGFILFDSDGLPIRKSNGRFASTESTLIAGVDAREANGTVTAFRIEGRLHVVKSDQFIPERSLVSLTSPGRIELASSNRTDRIISGLIGETLRPDQNGQLITRGQVHDTNWNFQDDEINKPLFCDQAGQATTTPPTSGISQIIGIVIDRDTIFLDPQMPILL